MGKKGTDGCYINLCSWQYRFFLEIAYLYRTSQCIIFLVWSADFKHIFHRSFCFNPLVDSLNIHCSKWRKNQPIIILCSHILLFLYFHSTCLLLHVSSCALDTKQMKSHPQIYLVFFYQCLPHILESSCLRT